MLIRETFERGTAYDLAELIEHAQRGLRFHGDARAARFARLLDDSVEDLRRIQQSRLRGRLLMLRIRPEELPQ